MEFSPHNNVVRLCLQGMQKEENGEDKNAAMFFEQAWKESTNDFEKYLAAYFVARHQPGITDRLQWFQTSLEFAKRINNSTVSAAYPTLYRNIANCYEDLGDIENANKYHAVAKSFTENPSNEGPFYHGTRAAMQVGDLLTPGFNSNYKDDLTMNHIYFTGLINGAGLAAALAKGDAMERVYVVEPTGSFENDPNVTNKKFPGNPTRSYRTAEPLKIIDEVKDWQKITPDQLKQWREKLANTKGDIIN